VAVEVLKDLDPESAFDIFTRQPFTQLIRDESTSEVDESKCDKLGLFAMSDKNTLAERRNERGHCLGERGALQPPQQQ